MLNIFSSGLRLLDPAVLLTNRIVHAVLKSDIQAQSFDGNFENMKCSNSVLEISASLAHCLCNRIRRTELSVLVNYFN